jgi:predicted RecA/RadA family phage recombinase
MKNFVKSGQVIEYTNGGGTTITSGSVVVMAGLIGIAVVDIVPGDRQSVNLEGVYELPLNGAIPAVGTPLAWDATNTRCDTDLTKGPFIGNVASTIADLTNGVRVKLPETGGRIPAGAHIAQIATADATDLASAEALSNANKAKINTLLTALQTAGILAAS